MSDSVPQPMAWALQDAGLSVPELYSDVPEWARIAWVYLPDGVRLQQAVRVVVLADAGESVLAAYALGGRRAVDGLLRGLCAEPKHARAAAEQRRRNAT